MREGRAAGPDGVFGEGDQEAFGARLPPDGDRRRDRIRGGRDAYFRESEKGRPQADRWRDPRP